MSRGVGVPVRFMVGDVARPPVVGATGAYAFDSLMFQADLGGTLRSIGVGLGAGSRLLATILVVGSKGPDRLLRTMRNVDAEIERVDDVTEALEALSLARSRAARGLVRDYITSPGSMLMLLLVMTEEALLRALLSRRRAGRWRIAIRYR